PLVGLAGPRRAPVRVIGRHEGFHVRQGEQGRPVLWRVAAERLDGAGHPGARVRGRAHRARRPPLAAAADDPGRDAPGDREPRLHLGAREVPRDSADHLQWRVGSSHDVHRVRPGGPETVLSSVTRMRGVAALAIYAGLYLGSVAILRKSPDFEAG